MRHPRCGTPLDPHINDGPEAYPARRLGSTVYAGIIPAMNSVVRQMLVVALLLATVAGLFVAAQLGQRRLEEASAQIALTAERQQALADLWQLLRQAESSQRGYILV